MRQATPPRQLLSPRDQDAVQASLRTLHHKSDLPVVFAGHCHGEALVLRQFIGVRSNAMRDLQVAVRTGLGGQVMDTRRPVTLEDYGASSQITKDYAHIVSCEGLRAMVAVPVMVAGATRCVLYGSARVVTSLGDRVQHGFMLAAQALGRELAIRDEVERRLELAQVAVVERSAGLAGSDRETLRAVHGELHAIAAGLGDPGLRDRLLSLGSQLAMVGRPADPPGTERPVLSAREIDVLSQVALGCSNAETAVRLSLSAETVKAYLRNVAGKLGTSSRLESVTAARRLGLLP